MGGSTVSRSATGGQASTRLYTGLPKSGRKA
ncbi:hypothetical protein NXF25_012669 [Crotalus adamanteus]|uniref:Uncharacterized protein n=1 Tax=Crotalus adamanteus TaxID=8729 RepID=A0AAW1BBX1_CROAD